jgi:hypothetical protein
MATAPGVLVSWTIPKYAGAVSFQGVADALHLSYQRRPVTSEDSAKGRREVAFAFVTSARDHIAFGDRAALKSQLAT